MQDDKFKRHKRRLPPTHEFLRHLLGRFSEVAYRIGLLALIWTVCGGKALAVVLAVDSVLIIGKTVFLIVVEQYDFNADTILLNVNQIIVLPSEEVFNGVSMDAPWHVLFGSIYCIEVDGQSRFDFCSLDGILLGSMLCVMNCCCCYGPAAILSVFSSFFTKCTCNATTYPMPTMRIGVSLMECAFLIIYAVFTENGTRSSFLFSDEHGLYAFIATCVFLMVYSQYLVLLPRFALPGNVAVRSRWGYAYANELSELTKIKVRVPDKYWWSIIVPTIGEEPDETARRYMERVQGQIVDQSGDTALDTFRVGNIEFKLYRTQHRGHDEPLRNLSAFWDQPHNGLADGFSAAMFALAKENYDIVQWLEDRGATLHIERNITPEKARALLEAYSTK